MRLNRFYVENVHDKGGKLELSTKLWIHNEKLLKQWLKVLKFREHDELILFNRQTQRIYKIDKIEYPHSVHLNLVTESEIKMPKRHIYLFWSLLKKDKNDIVLQKATELGVKEFVPIISERTENKEINLERSKQIIIEASEQCGRFDIPTLREPSLLKQILNEYKDLKIFLCDVSNNHNDNVGFERAGVLIGPEGGWSDNEKSLFKENQFERLYLSDFTLRAETASIVAVSKLLQ